MDWKYWVTTAIALFAVVVAWRARREASQSSETANSLQERLEVYEHYPIIHVDIEPKDNKVRISLTNASAKNSALSCEITATLRIHAGDGAYSVNKEQLKFSSAMLPPQSVEHIYPEEINELVADSIPFLNRYPSDQNNFVIRVTVECAAPHPKSEKVREGAVAHFNVEDGSLILKSEIPFA